MSAACGRQVPGSDGDPLLFNLSSLPEMQRSCADEDELRRALRCAS